MKSRIWKLFLVFIMMITIVGCGKEKEKELEKEPIVEINNNDALLWEVKSDTATVYLAGSIHVADEETYPLQKKLLDAFEASDALAVEVDVVSMLEDTELLQKVSTMMIYLDETDLSDNLSDETLDMFDKYVQEYGISGITSTNIELLYMYKPWALESLISNDIIMEAGFSADSGIDMYFINEAISKGMEIIEIESALFQYGMLDGFSDELQEYLLRISLETPREEMVEEYQSLLDTWEKGDIIALEEMLFTEEELADEEAKLVEEYNQKMIIERNVGMTDKVEELLKGDKDVFYIVGSAHMIGEKGIVKLLEERGYTVTKL